MKIVEISYGFTKNLGNFQSQRMDVKVRIDEDVFGDDPDAALELAVAFVNEALDLKLTTREEQVLAVYRESLQLIRARAIEEIR